MKNYVIGALIVVILMLSSLLYKYYTTTKTLSVSFPMEVEIEESDKSHKLYLYVFFSKNNCKDCLEIIDTLNSLPPSMFLVKGVVPESELKDIKGLRSITGATFPLEGESKFRKLIPKYTPSIVGLSEKSDLFFVLPGVPGEKDYLRKFLYSIYQKLNPYLIAP